MAGFDIRTVQRVFGRFKLIRWGHSKLRHLTYFQFSLKASKYAVTCMWFSVDAATAAAEFYLYGCFHSNPSVPRNKIGKVGGGPFGAINECGKRSNNNSNKIITQNSLEFISEKCRLNEERARKKFSLSEPRIQQQQQQQQEQQ